MKKKFIKFIVLSLFVMGHLIAKTPNNEDQLLAAAEAGHHHLVASLIQKKVDVNTQAKLGETPLIVACLAGHTEIVKLLALQGANVNASLKSGDAPLYIAIRNGNLPMVKILIEQGASISRPFTYAMTFQQFEIASYLYDIYVQKTIAKGNIEELKELLEPLSSYKKLITLPIQHYIDELSAHPAIENKEEILKLLASYL